MRRAARRVAILGHVRRSEVREAARRLRGSLLRAGHQVQVEEDLARELGQPGWPLARLAAWCHLLVALGGDGTALTGGRALLGRRGALLAVNLGGLGFLTVAEQGELGEAVQATLRGAWPVTQRRLVAVSVKRDYQVAFRGAAMNDAVVRDASGFAAIHLRVQADGADLGHLVADGAVVASAAGSTAYSLSAGGPVVAPDLEVLVVTPVCPHTLASRPLVVGAEALVSMSLLGPQRGVVLLDGHERATLERGDAIGFGLTRRAVRLVQRPDRTWTATLAAKLGWQGSERRSL